SSPVIAGPPGRRPGPAPYGAARRTRPSRSGVLSVEVTYGVAGVDLPRPGDLLLRVGGTLLPVGEPPGHPADREQHGEHGHGEAHRLVDDARVEVHVRVQLVAYEV